MSLALLAGFTISFRTFFCKYWVAIMFRLISMWVSYRLAAPVMAQLATSVLAKYLACFHYRTNYADLFLFYTWQCSVLETIITSHQRWWRFCDYSKGKRNNLICFFLLKENMVIHKHALMVHIIMFKYTQMNQRVQTIRRHHFCGKRTGGKVSLYKRNVSTIVGDNEFEYMLLFKFSTRRFI